jgi:hypothetical protein
MSDEEMAETKVIACLAPGYLVQGPEQVKKHNIYIGFVEDRPLEVFIDLAIGDEFRFHWPRDLMFDAVEDTEGMKWLGHGRMTTFTNPGSKIVFFRINFGEPGYFVFGLELNHVVQFLAATETLVPHGEESLDIDWDSEMGNLFGDSP